MVGYRVVLGIFSSRVLWFTVPNHDLVVMSVDYFFNVSGSKFNWYITSQVKIFVDMLSSQ